MRLTTEETPSPIDTAITALEDDLLHAEEGVETSRKNWLDAGTDDPHLTAHLRNVYQYNSGFRDAIKEVINLLNRGNR